jgi:hypothetical protein
MMFIYFLGLCSLAIVLFALYIFLGVFALSALEIERPLDNNVASFLLLMWPIAVFYSIKNYFASLSFEDMKKKCQNLSNMFHDGLAIAKKAGKKED